MSFHYSDISPLAQTLRNCEHVLEQGERRLKAEAANFAKHRAEMQAAIKRTEEQVKPTAPSLCKTDRKEYDRQKRKRAALRVKFVAAMRSGASISVSAERAGCTIAQANNWANHANLLEEQLQANRPIMEHAIKHGVPAQMIDHENGWKKTTAYCLARRMGVMVARITDGRPRDVDAANAAAESAGYKCRAERRRGKTFVLVDPVAVAA